MKNKALWTPTKFVFKNKKLRASKDPLQVSISSRLITDIIAKFYDTRLKVYANGDLLDLGCGNVPLYDAYKNYVTSNICIDWENSLHKNKYLDFNVDLNLALPLKDNQFDTIICSDVLEHIRDPNLLWKEMSRIIKDEGVLLLNVPFFYWLHEEPFDYFRYTSHALKSMAENNNFEIIELTPYGGVPEIIADISSKWIINIPYFGKIFAKIIQGITSTFLKLRIGKKISKSSSKQFPFGYFLIAKKINGGK